MPRTPQRAGWWRFPAPSILVFTLIVGILPWVEVGCEGKPQDFQAWQQDPLTGKKRSRPIGESGKVVLATQNGYQAIWGGSSPGPEIREMQREAEEMGKEMAKQMGPVQPPPNAPKAPKPAPKKDEDSPDAAPLLGVYFALVLVSAVVGFAMPPGLLRTAIFGGLVALAVAALGTQVAIGLPVKKKADDPKNANHPIKFDNGIQMDMPNLGGPKPYCRYTPWYYLSWPFLLIPVGLVGVEETVALVSRAGKKKPKKRRYEEEDEDDEDDRPRKRRRREDDEDDEEDEDPPPRKRRRGEDDDEDEERPRRRQRF